MNPDFDFFKIHQKIEPQKGDYSSPSHFCLVISLAAQLFYLSNIPLQVLLGLYSINPSKRRLIRFLQ